MAESTAPVTARPVRRLLPGGRVRVIAPSSPFDPARLAAGVTRLREAGYVVDDDDVLRGRHAYLNGDDDERARRLSDALASDADCVWLARGGYGLTRILDRVVLPDGPLPVVVGFSDATALLSWMRARGAHGVHGPLATSLATEPEASATHLFDVLAGRARGHTLPARALSPGRGTTTTGWLYPANLCVLSHLVGTDALPSLAGAIVVLEEIGERPYRIDRMLTQLLAAGALDDVTALAIGHLTGCDESGTPSGARDPAPTPLDVIAERAATRDLPVVRGLPVGHTAPNFALPVGAPARLDVDDDGAATLTLEGELPGVD